MATPITAQVKPPVLGDYLPMYNSIVMQPLFARQAAIEAGAIVKNKLIYDDITKATGVPYYIIGLIHLQECGGSFKRHLHNGDPLTARTVKVPKGRPLVGNPPFSFVESAIDALKVDGFAQVKDWSITNTLYMLEKFNGGGYRKRGINTPYLWSGSQFYLKGKYVDDGVFDANYVSKQVGLALVLKSLNVV